jgi:hypothetical protein
LEYSGSQFSRRITWLWLKLPYVSLTFGGTGFVPRPLHVGFLVGKMTQRVFRLRGLRSTPFIVNPQIFDKRSLFTYY